MTIGIDAFMQDFTPEERAKVAARLAELIEAELTGRRSVTGQASDAGADGGTDGGGAGERGSP